MLHGSTAGTAPQVQHNKPFASPAGSLGFAIAPRACLEPRHACCQGQAPAPAAAPMGGSPQHPTCGQPAPNTAVPAQRWVRSRIAGAALRADGAGEGGARAGAKGVEDLVHAHIVPRRRRGRGRAGQWGAWQWKAGCKALNSGSSNPQTPCMVRERSAGSSLQQGATAQARPSAREARLPRRPTTALDAKWARAAAY